MLIRYAANGSKREVNEKIGAVLVSRGIASAMNEPRALQAEKKPATSAAPKPAKKKKKKTAKKKTPKKQTYQTRHIVADGAA